MKKTCLLALWTLAAVPAAFAQENAKIEPYQPKNKSSFDVTQGARVPFWPIGWTKEKATAAPVAVATPQAKAFLIEPQHFTVTSILLSHPPLATINRRSFGEGEALPVVVGGKRLNVVVKAIRDGGVWLDQSGHQIFVPLQRQEIPSRPTNDPKTQPSEFTIQINPTGTGR